MYAQPLPLAFTVYKDLLSGIEAAYKMVDRYISLERFTLNSLFIYIDLKIPFHFHPVVLDTCKIWRYRTVVSRVSYMSNKDGHKVSTGNNS